MKNNQITSLPSGIGQLKKLTTMDLDKNVLTTLRHEIGQLTNLKSLNLNNNQIITLPHEIGQLTNLTALNLINNQLTTLPPEIGQLKNLTSLEVYINQITSLPAEIGQLTKLTSLEVYINQLTTLPPEVGQLKNLTALSLNNNQLTTLPSEICQLNNLISLNLNNNPIKQPPPEIATAISNIRRIRDYFTELATQGEDYIYEAKLILVGEPGAGKTSLVQKLMDPNFKLSPTEPMTKGIDVYTWNFPYSEDIHFQCNIWDFGGQEIMHATHRYFLTKRSLYLLVADNRKDDTDFYYWLNILELLSGKSPVLIINNEKFKYKKYVPENILKSFMSVKELFNVNLATNKGLADLSSTIKQYMHNLPHVGKDPIPKKWVQIRKDLEKNKNDYISIKDYYKICNMYDITDKEKAGYISEFLHDLGVLLHFQQDRILCNTLILNTKWATEAVYLVLLDNTIIGNGGKFDNKDLERVWYEAHYNSKHGELLQLMLNFELCYEIENTQTYIIPELLPEKPTSDKEFWGDEHLREKGLIHFEHRYDFMPKGIISRLIVRMNKYIYKKQQWKSGVILQIGNCCAELIEYINDKKLKIRISGPDRLEALAVIRNIVYELHITFENLKSHEMVPCNCEECLKLVEPNFFDYDELKQYKDEGLNTIRCRIGNIKDVNVLGLISDVFVTEDFDKLDQILKEKGIVLKINQIVKQNNVQKQEVKLKTSQVVKVSIDIKVDLPAIQNGFAELKGTMSDFDPKLKDELNRIEDSLDEVSAEDDKKELKKSLNKLGRFLKKIDDENSDFHKAVKGAKNAIEMAQKVGKIYNKFAQWLALPQVPDLFLGN